MEAHTGVSLMPWSLVRGTSWEIGPLDTIPTSNTSPSFLSPPDATLWNLGPEVALTETRKGLPGDPVAHGPSSKTESFYSPALVPPPREYKGGFWGSSC